MNTIKLRQLAWYDPKELVLPLPDGWQIEVYNMAGYNRPALKPDEIKTAISKPIGTTPIRELAKGKKEVVIIFDDMTRVTRVAEISLFTITTPSVTVPMLVRQLPSGPRFTSMKR